MSKKLLAAVFAAAFLMASLTACGGKIELAKDGSAAVTATNGGLSVETGDYLYFINGQELYTENNEQGKVDKGALVRVKKAELEKGAEAEVEVVVSRLLSAGDHTSGLYIFGDKLYFATPSNVKSKTGNVQYDDLEFYVVSTNGTGLKKIVTTTGSAGNSAAYRFVSVGDKVYLVYVSTEPEEEGSTTNKNYINVVSESGEKIAKEEYVSYVFDKDLDGEYVWYTKGVHNDVLEQDEAYNEVYRLKIGDKEGQKVLSGIGSNRDDDEHKYENKGIKGVSFTLIAAQNGYLYFSVVNLDTSVSTDTFYSFVKEDIATADVEANYKGLTKMTYNGSSSVFAAGSIYVKPDLIFYLDSSNGFCSYNYTISGEYNKDPEAGDNYGSIIEYYSSDILTATLAYVADGYLYYHISGVYYRLPFSGVSGTMKDAKPEKLSSVTYATDWYNAEVVKSGDKEYLIGTLSSNDYMDYIAALPVMDKDALDELALSDNYDVKSFLTSFITDEDELADALEDLEETKYGDFIAGSGRNNVHYVWKKMLAHLGEEAEGKVNDYLDSTYPDGSSSGSSSEGEGCGSSASAGTALAFVMLGSAFVMVSNKKREK